MKVKLYVILFRLSAICLLLGGAWVIATRPPIDHTGLLVVILGFLVGVETQLVEIREQLR